MNTGVTVSACRQATGFSNKHNFINLETKQTYSAFNPIKTQIFYIFVTVMQQLLVSNKNFGVSSVKTSSQLPISDKSIIFNQGTKF
jgi:hypothetical protein